MLDRFEVKGFKSLVDVGIDLGAVNVFIGANGSGKSNVLEALGFLGAILSNAKDAEAFRYRGIRLGDSSSFLSSISEIGTNTISFSVIHGQHEYRSTVVPRAKRINEWSFQSEDLFANDTHYASRNKDLLEMEFPAGNKLESIDISDTQSFIHMLPFIFTLVQHFAEGQLTAVQKGDESIKNMFSVLGGLDFADIINLSTGFAIYSPSTPQLRGFLDDIQRDPIGLGGSSLGNAIAEMSVDDFEKLGPFDMADVLDLIEWADGIETTAGTAGTSLDGPIRLRLSDRFMINKKREVSATESSEGALYVLFLLALIGHERSPKIFAVDNFDQALHPRLARSLTKMICDQILADGTRQMFATTHNPLVLDGLNLRDDRIRLFAVDRDWQGATKVRRIEVTPQLLDQAESGLSLSQLWVMGRLGGVPQNF